ncbi:MAG: signal transduction histidine kinase [Neolewinella sp.]|jgi:signal transduction histidine kinase
MSEVSMNGNDLSATDKLCLSAQVRHRAVGEDGVLVHLQNGRVIVVNEVGQHIVQLLQNPISTMSITESISAKFDVTPQQAESDITKFLAELDQENIFDHIPQVDCDE